ncbi:hypothetical protein [Mesorhizobium sp.]|uniref:hypothetical protein n=1 Tax=Mesorhizobium sp. TaxID=1871066 RepID=UPI0025F00EF3|nr:hypothetical protein [Mesorhizobium sp.]
MHHAGKMHPCGKEVVSLITKLLSRTEFVLTEKLPDGQTAVRMEDAAIPWPRMQSALSLEGQVLALNNMPDPFCATISLQNRSSQAFYNFSRWTRGGL